ncbi:MAG TPA: hypothetical protein VEA44_04230, partial [Caulobacter sp.]|nr:hypothetical protein [Caulobacter sp.]
DRGAMFWGVLFPALFIFGLSFLETSLALLIKGGPPSAKSVNLAMAAVQGFNWANAFPIQLFVLLGVGAMFAGDYRWETWRLQTPRNSRVNLVLSKILAYAVLALAALLLLALASCLAALVRGLLLNQPFVPFGEGVTPLLVLRGIAAGWLELMEVGAMGALVAIATRSNMAGLLVPVFATAAQYFGLLFNQIHPGVAMPDIILLCPNLAAQVLRGDGGAPYVGWALLGLIGWTLVFAVGAIALFNRQELTRE